MAKTINITELNKRIQKMRSDGVPEGQIQSVVSQLKESGKVEEASLGNTVKDIGASLVQPFTDLGRNAVALGMAGTGLAQGLLGDEAAMQRSAQRASDVLTPTQRQAYTSGAGEATMQGLRTGAGLAQWAVPAGKTAKAATTLGAVGGAMRGFYDTQGKGAEETIKGLGYGAAGGAIAGGLTYKAGQLLQRAKKSSALRSVNPQVSSGPDSIVRERQLQQVADDLGLTGTPDQKRTQIATLMREYSDEIDDILKTSKSSRKYNGVINEIKRSVLNNGEYYTGTSAQQKALNTQLELLKKKATDGILTAKDVYDFKKAIPVDKAFKTIAKGGEVTVEKQQVALDIWNSIDDILTRMAPEVKEQTIKQSNLYKLAPGLEKLAKETYNLPLVHVPVSTQLPRGAGDIVGRIGQKVGALERAAGGVAMQPAVQQAAQPIFRQVGSMAATQNLPQTTIDSQGINQEFENQNLLQNTVGPQEASVGAGGGEDMYTPLDYMSAQKMAGQGVDVSNRFIVMLDGKTIWNPFSQKLEPYAAPKSAQNKEQMDAAAKGIGRLESLYGTVQKQGETSQGPGVVGEGRLGGVKGTMATIQQKTPYAAAYNAAREGFLASLARASGEKGTLNEGDVKRVKKNLPTFYDTPDTAREKFNNLKAIIPSIVAKAQAANDQELLNSINEVLGSY